MYNGNASTSHYTEYGTLPTLTEQQKEDLLSAKELPAVSSTDNGKVLTVVSGAWAKAAIPAQLPSVSGTDNGKALMVSGGKWQKSSLPDAGADTKGLVKQAANVAESSATTVADLKGTVNAILTALKAAGIMVADAEEPAET